ncbi:MAG: hypothetical protein Q9181_004308 [Wetmoreana brouardii]
MAGAFEKSEATTLTNPTSMPDVKTLAEDQGIKAVQDIAFGSTSGILGKVIEYPFDTIKVRLQSQPHPPVYSGPWDCFRQSFYTPEGAFRSLYRGISAPLFGAAIETGSLFFSYRLAQSALQTLDPSLPQEKGEKLPLKALTACAAVSGATTSILLTPIELVKCKLQYPIAASSDNGILTPHQRRGPLTVIASVFRNHGILGFWRGQLGTLIRETGGTAAWFGSYEAVLTALRNRSLPHSPPDTTTESNRSHSPISHQLLAGASAGMAYNFLFFPADTIKSRMQTEELASTDLAKKGSQTTFLRTASQLWHQQGLRGLYRGCGITVARSAPSSAIIFTVMEMLRGWAG